MKWSLVAAFAAMLLFAPSVAAANDPVAADLIERLNQLEAETRVLRAELAGVRAQLVRLPAVDEGTPAMPASMRRAEGPPPADAEYYALPELKAEMKKLVWTKGDFRVVPYGFLWGSMIYQTERVTPGAYALYVPSATIEGEDAFVIDTRRTRVGLDVFGPDVQLPIFGWMHSSGRIEIDMHGAFVVENKPGVLFRHAYGDLKNDRYRILAGQTWDVISPLYPGTLSYSVGWGGGNMGYRRAQVRGERYLAFSDRALVTLQGSLNQNIVSDFSSTAGVQAEDADWPLIEGRLAVTLGPRGKNCHPAEFGISSHIGNQGFDFVAVGPPPPSLPIRDDVRVRTWSLNLDARVPVTDRMGVQGELFTGENLSTFLGGVVQGVDPFTRRAIRSSGGWIEVWYDWTPRLHSHVGCGIDDPRDNDIVSGRSYNHFLFGNVTYDVTEKLNVGFEVASWKTLYRETRPGEPQLRPGDSLLFEFSGRYGF